MPLTRTTTLKLVKIVSVILIVLVIAIFAVSRSFSYARGPHITVSEPINGSLITASTTLIKGQIQRANNVTLNGKSISTDEAGNFSETLIIFPGSNILTLVASDQFQRSVTTQLYLIKK
ncbi:MAG: hypothetical protein M3Q80_00715 [bacterium]|nr:hypothetical protein [bacterium]